MQSGEFRFAYYAEDYEATISFYEDDLGFKVAHRWNRGSDDAGTLFSAASGLVEILRLPRGQTFGRQRGAVVIEVDDVDAWSDRLRQAAVSIDQQPTDKPWGHRDLVIHDPSGLRLVFFSPLVGSGDERPAGR
ncbi:MAG: VOC family protein [Solirubrobacterales bacterium]